MMMSQAASNLENNDGDEEDRGTNTMNRNTNQNNNNNTGNRRTREWNENNNKNREDYNSPPSQNEMKYFSDLIAMGFSEELVRPVLENCTNKPLHELVTILSDMQEVFILFLFFFFLFL